MGDWKIFKGNATPHGDIDRLPPPPNWRKFGFGQVCAIDELVVAYPELFGFKF